MNSSEPLSLWSELFDPYLFRTFKGFTEWFPLDENLAKIMLENQNLSLEHFSMAYFEHNKIVGWYLGTYIPTGKGALRYIISDKETDAIISLHDVLGSTFNLTFSTYQGFIKSKLGMACVA